MPAIPDRDANLRPASPARPFAALVAWLEAHPNTSFLGLLAVYLPSALAQSSRHLLWHDELFTLYIAQATSLRQLFADLRQVDLNPPLSYLLSRASLSVFPSGTLACRLPEIASFAAAMFFLFRFVRRRAGVSFALCSASLLFSSLAGELATDARPYALLLAFTALGLLAWQRSETLSRGRRLTLLLLSLSASGMLLSHVFGLLSWVALALGQLRRAPGRRFDWTANLAFSTPLLCVGLYLPMLQSHGASAFPAAFQPGGEDVFNFYVQHVDREAITLLLTALLTSILLGRTRLRGRRSWLFSPSEWVSILALLAIPGVIIARLMLSHGAFFPRYGVVASLAVALLATALLALWTGGEPRSALLAALLSLTISGNGSSFVQGLPMLLSRNPFRASEPRPQTCDACLLSASIDPRLPLVVASGLTFVEMDHRESALTLDRVFFLTDPAAAMQFAHATIFNGMDLERRLFPLRAHVEEDLTFFRQHRHFFVLGQYDYPEDWLLRKLNADGANLRRLRDVSGDYKDQELYEVTLPPIPAPPNPSPNPSPSRTIPNPSPDPGISTH